MPTKTNETHSLEDPLVANTNETQTEPLAALAASLVES